MFLFVSRLFVDSVMASFDPAFPHHSEVIPAKAGIQPLSGPFLEACRVDSRFRGNDVWAGHTYRPNDATTVGCRRAKPCGGWSYGVQLCQLKLTADNVAPSLVLQRLCGLC
jgi:hypothetical protein